MPVPYAKALGPVETGSKKPKLHAILTAIATGITGNWADCATAIISGTMTFAEAVLEVASLKARLSTMPAATSSQRPGVPSQ